MTAYFETNAWTQSLGPRPRDRARLPRERLRAAYETFRERAVMLADQIATDLPDLTVHDGTHLDALWEMVDICTSGRAGLNAAEGFVFGGAVLLHDLGMAVAAYPNGLASLREEPGWSDTIAGLLRDRLEHPPSLADVRAPSPEIERLALAVIVRERHACQAETLASTAWTDSAGTQHYLIEDVDLRMSYGALIGTIARSHWWSVDELANRFETQLGALSWCPRDWTVDPLRIASLLRIADATHLDGRRAPRFRRALIDPNGIAAAHWSFQERLHKPRLNDERLEFTTAEPFAKNDVTAWWLCRDMLVEVDRELREVDTLLADSGRLRIAARSVAGVEQPDRLARYIPTAGWTPLDVRVQVSDVAALVQKLGGVELYGRDYSVPLREAIQNAADAIRARRLQEERPADWGEITISTQESDGDVWVNIEDVGVGMSKHVLAGPLLDFGKSFWATEAVTRVFPGLLAKGFAPTGRFGIGFFSAFVWGCRVQAISRDYRAAQAETLVLELPDGLGSRPLLCPASGEEVLRDGGTRLRIRLEDDARQALDPDRSGAAGIAESLASFVVDTAPALDVTVAVRHADGGVDRPLMANDWRTVDADRLLHRTQRRSWDAAPDVAESIIQHLAKNVRDLTDDDGMVWGRAALAPRFDDGMPLRLGIVTVGGLYACDLANFAGLLLGNAVRAARDLAEPAVPFPVLARWATEQAELVHASTENIDERQEAAGVVRRCRGHTGPLAIAEWCKRQVTFGELSESDDLPPEIVLVDLNEVRRETQLNGPFEPHAHVMVAQGAWSGFLWGTHSRTESSWPFGLMLSQDAPVHPWIMRSLQGAVVEAVAANWKTEVEVLLANADCSRPMYDVRPLEIGVRDGKSVLATDWNRIRRP